MTADWPVPAGLHAASVPLPVEGELASFGGATGWLNSEPLTAAGLRGRVVLVSFWTYTCINWLRQLPYVRAWAERYAGQGLVVVGVHTPEFGFEHDPANVRRAVPELRDRLPGRDRQRLRGVARVRQPLLARAVLRRRAGADPAPPVRRGRVPAVGDGDPAAAGRGRSGGVGQELVVGRARRPRRPRPTGTACDRRRTTPATSAPRTSPRPAARCRASRRPTPSRSGWCSTSGPWPGTGPWGSRPPR